MTQVNFNPFAMTKMNPFRAFTFKAYPLGTFSFRAFPFRALTLCTLLLFGLMGPRDLQAQLLAADDEPALSPNAGFTIAGNVVNATTTGAILGLATMALEDGTDYQRPLSVGVGIGMLAGVGLSIYDLASVSPGDAVLQRGLFASGSNTSLLLLMDTIYGAALGSIVGTAVILVSGDELTDGLQYGAATGAFVGASFGLVDAFLLDFEKSFAPGGTDNDMPPLVEAWSNGVPLKGGFEGVSQNNSGSSVQNSKSHSSLHFLQPTMNSFKSVGIAPNSGRGLGSQRVSVGLELIALRVSL